MPKGNIVLIPFPFTDLTGSKLRPALVLVDSNLDLTISFITTQLQWQEPTDIILQLDAYNGIKKVSLIRLSKIATVDRTLIVGRIGDIDPVRITDLNAKLKLLFNIP